MYPSSSSIADELYHNEELVSQSFPAVGIYSGNVKLSPPYDNVVVHLTTHRIVLSLPSSSSSSSPHPSSPFQNDSSTTPRTILHSLALDRVRQTEFYAGFLKSSPKITLTLAPSPSPNPPFPTHQALSSSRLTLPSPNPSSPHPITATALYAAVPSGEGGWPCPLCGFLNPQPAPGSTERTIKCLTCGVSRKDSLFAVPPSSGTPSRSGTPVAVALSPPGQGGKEDGARDGGGGGGGGGGGEGIEIACPQCTFLNHPDLPSCEICSSPLPSRSSRRQQRSTQLDSASSIVQPSPVSSHIPPPPSPSSYVAPSPVLPRLKDDPSNEPFSGTVVRLSFRRGGAPVFYGILKSTLSDRKWDDGASRLPNNNPSSPSISSPSNATAPSGAARPGGPAHTDSRGTGLDRILNTINLDESTKSDAIESSMKDLESLMAKAGEMAKLAQTLSHKLSLLPPSTLASDPTAQSTAQTLNTTLAQLGLPPAPSTSSNISLNGPALTQDMLVGSEREKEKERAYLEGLARELGGVLVEGGLMVEGNRKDKGRNNGNGNGKGKGREDIKARGIIGLDEVWCVWNRARGVALISPKTMLSCLSYLPSVTNPSIALREFSAAAPTSTTTTTSSPLRVLHTPHYSPASFRSRLLASLRPSSPPSTPTRPLLDALRGDARAPDDSAEETFDSLLPSLSTIELALGEDISVGLAKAMVEELEASDGSVCRDSQAKSGGGGESWYANLIDEAWAELQSRQEHTSRI